MIKQLVIGAVRRLGEEPKRSSGSPHQARAGRTWVVGSLIAVLALCPVAGSADLSGLLSALDASGRALSLKLPHEELSQWNPLEDSLQGVLPVPTSASAAVRHPWPADLRRIPSAAYVPRNVTATYLEDRLAQARSLAPASLSPLADVVDSPALEALSSLHVLEFLDRPAGARFGSVPPIEAIMPPVGAAVEPSFPTLAETVKAVVPLADPPPKPVAAAETAAKPPVQSAEEVVGAALPVATPKGAPRTGLDGTVCSLNVADWDLAKVLQALSVQTQANLLLQAPANTKLTINLNNVPLIDMLRHITALSNLSFLKVENTYVIAESDRLAKGYPVEWSEAHPTEVPVEPAKAAVMTRVYLSNYVKASQIAEALKAIFESQGLSVSGGPTQVSPKIVSRDTANVTGITTGSVATTGASDNLSRLVILRGPEDLVEAAIAVAKSIDLARAQVAIAVSIHDITNDALKELGLSWSFGDVGITESQGNGVNFGAFTRAPQSFTAAISALEKSDKAKLLASPNVSVLDGEQAFILIGNRINYPVLIGYTQLNTPIFDKETEKVGIYLQVAASISSDNMITLSLYPQVSTITGFLQVNGASYPQIATREAQTTLRVANGETIVMGGLLRDEEISNMEKVPLLGDIPILGELFKRRKSTKTSSQVLIAITPVVIAPKD